MEGHELLADPAVEVPDVDPVGQALRSEGCGQRGTQGLVETHHEHWFRSGCGDLREVFRAVAEDHGLARPGDAVDDSVSTAEAAGQLLLLQVHDLHDVGELDALNSAVAPHALVRRASVSLGRLEQGRVRRVHPNVGEHDPSHPIQLRQSEFRGKSLREHPPQALLEDLRIDRLGHLVGADHGMTVDDLRQPGPLELGAGDLREHHAIPPGEGELALMSSRAVHELWIALQGTDHVVRPMPGLQDRVDDPLVSSRGRDVPQLAGDPLDDAQGPVLRLKDEHPSTRVQHHEIRMCAHRSDGHVEPHQIVVIELLPEPLGQSSFTGCHPWGSAAQRRDQRAHGWQANALTFSRNLNHTKDVP